MWRSYHWATSAAPSVKHDHCNLYNLLSLLINTNNHNAGLNNNVNHVPPVLLKSSPTSLGFALIATARRKVATEVLQQLVLLKELGRNSSWVKFNLSIYTLRPGLKCLVMTTTRSTDRSWDGRDSNISYFLISKYKLCFVRGYVHQTSFQS